MNRGVFLSTLGSGSYDERRIESLLLKTELEKFDFDRQHKRLSFRRLWERIRADRPKIVVLEGTGLAGGVAVLLTNLLFGQPYIVSSGDAVGPWMATKSWWLTPLFSWYERWLYGRAAGFIGWTPYLVGRALTFGASRGITAAGWAPFTSDPSRHMVDRAAMRDRFKVAPHELVVGMAGSIVWSNRRKYCYGLELVEAARRCSRSDVKWLIVGDGDGLRRLKLLADQHQLSNVIFTGRVPQSELPAYYAAMDVASLPQSVDGVGNFRYTTKVSEYLAFRLPFIVNQTPMAYDLPENWFWRLPGSAPWDTRYLDAFANLIDGVTHEEIAAKSQSIPTSIDLFDRQSQIDRVTAFVQDILDELPAR